MIVAFQRETFYDLNDLIFSTLYITALYNLCPFLCFPFSISKSSLHRRRLGCENKTNQIRLSSEAIKVIHPFFREAAYSFSGIS
jgi:hypothetical protein